MRRFTVKPSDIDIEVITMRKSTIRYMDRVVESVIKKHPTLSDYEKETLRKFRSGNSTLANTEQKRKGKYFIELGNIKSFEELLPTLIHELLHAVLLYRFGPKISHSIDSKSPSDAFHFLQYDAFHGGFQWRRTEPLYRSSHI